MSAASLYPSIIILILAVLCACAAAPPPAVVATAAGCPDSCSLLGECVAGACRCDPGWTGPDCSRATLQPLGADAGLVNATSATWGGRPVRGGDGNYHLFATEISNGCPLTVFFNNSQVIRAVSPTLLGEFAGGVRLIVIIIILFSVWLFF